MIQKSTRKLLAIRHVPFEDLGSLAPILAEYGFEIQYIEAGLDDIARIELRAQDSLVILGGPIGADQETTYPFILDELRLVERCLARDQPVLGICLGAQIMARALGAHIHPAQRPEIGWAPLHLTEAGQHSWLAPLAAVDAVFHWHGDTFESPQGSHHLASTKGCAQQAFAWGSHCLGLQFHPEVLVSNLERWYIGHAHELGATPGTTVFDLRRDAEIYGVRMQHCAAQIWRGWLESIVRSER